MKSIALITTQAYSLVNFRGSLIRRLVDQGVCVYAMAPDFEELTRSQLKSLGCILVDIDFQRNGMSPWNDLQSTFALVRQLTAIKPDAVLAYFIKPVIYGVMASWIARVPRRVAMIEGLGYVFSAQFQRKWSVGAVKRRALRYLVSQMYRAALVHAHRVIFLNQDDVSQFVQSGLVDKEKVELLGGIGVDLTYWRINSRPNGPLTFLLAARLLREKGIVEYAAAASQIKAKHPEVRFLLVGALDTNPGALDRVDVDAWVEDGVLEWPGHVEMKPWLEQTSVFVLPSYREGLPRSTQEAMAMGLAIITTDVPGCRETVVDGVNGYQIPVRDVDALVRAMDQMIEHPERIIAMGLESRRIAEQKFDANKIDSRLMEILNLP